MKISIKTLGCKANRYESDRLREKFTDRAEFVEPHEKADICIVNTCTVTGVADRKSRLATNALRSLNPKAKIVVFGCGPRVDNEKYKEMLNVDLVATEPAQVEKFLYKHLDGHHEHTDHAAPSRTRAVIKIQDGCNNFCTYCIIPHSRGRETSFSISKIMEEIKSKELQGYKEIVLTGIHIGHFNYKGTDLADLVWKILKETGIPRIRLSSLEPENFSDKFLKLLKEPRFCRHLHMSLQSGSDTVLRRMNRKYDTKLFADVVAKIRKIAPETSITTDVITGFPGETAKNHKESMAFVRKMKFAKLHVFPFSRRPKTPAYSMPDQIPQEVKRARADEMRVIGRKLREEFVKSQIGKEYEVLFEEKKVGWTDNYIKVKASDKTLVNQILRVKLDAKVLGSF